MTMRKRRRTRLNEPVGFRSIARAHVAGKGFWKVSNSAVSRRAARGRPASDGGQVDDFELST
jgi:hypothetical protein